MKNSSTKPVKTANVRQVLKWLKALRGDFRKYMNSVNRINSFKFTLHASVFHMCDEHSGVTENVNLGVNRGSNLVFLKNFNNFAFLKKFLLSRTKPGAFASPFWKLWQIAYLSVLFIFVLLLVNLILIFFFSFVPKLPTLAPSQPLLFKISGVEVLGFFRLKLTPLHTFFQTIIDVYFEYVGVFSAAISRIVFTLLPYLFTLPYDQVDAGVGIQDGFLEWHHSLLLLLIVIFIVGLATSIRFFWAAYLKRADVWPFLLHFSFPANSIESFFSFSALKQVFGSKTANVLYSDYRFMGEYSRPRINKLLYDFNANVGFGGYVGYVDYFPGYDSFLNYASFKKSRIHFNKLFYFFWQISKRHGYIKRVYAIGTALKTPFREKHFLSNSKFNRHNSVKKNPPGRPQFRLPVWTPNIFISILSAFMVIVPSGDPFIAGFRERLYYFLLSVGRTWFVDDEDNAEITTSMPAEYTIGNSSDWYNRDVNSVLLARTVYKKIRTKNARIFKFGWQSSINSHTFWDTSEEFWDDENIGHHFYENEENSYYEDLTEFSGLDLYEPKNGYYNDWDYDFPVLLEEDDTENGPEDIVDFEQDEEFYGSGGLHISQDGEAMFEEDDEEEAEELIEAGFDPDDPYEEDSHDFLEFIGNPFFAYGGGDEADYLELHREHKAGNTLLRPEHGSLKQNMVADSSLFYDDIVDLYWLNSYWSTYRNFFEYPSGRYFNIFRRFKRYRKYHSRKNRKKTFSRNLLTQSPHLVSEFLFLPFFYFYYMMALDMLLSVCWMGWPIAVILSVNILALKLGVFSLYVFWVSFFSAFSIVVLILITYLSWIFVKNWHFRLLEQPFGRLNPALHVYMFFIWTLAWTFIEQRVNASFPATDKIKWNAKKTGSLSLLKVGSSVEASDFAEIVIARSKILGNNRLGWRAAAIFQYNVCKSQTAVNNLVTSTRSYFTSFFFSSFCDNSVKIGCDYNGSAVGVLNNFGVVTQKTGGDTSCIMAVFFSVSEDAPCIFYNELPNFYASRETPLIANILFADFQRQMIKNSFFFKPHRNLKAWFAGSLLNNSRSQIRAGLIYNSTHNSFLLAPNTLNNLEDGWLAKNSQFVVGTSSDVNTSGAHNWRQGFWKTRPKKPGTYFSAHQFGSSAGASPSNFTAQTYTNFLRLIFSWDYTQSAFSERFSKSWRQKY